MGQKKILYFDLEHGAKTLGSDKDMLNLFGYPTLKPNTYREFQGIMKQLYSKKNVESSIDIGGIKLKQTEAKVVPNNSTQIDGIVIDTISELSKKYMRSLMGSNNKMEFGDWSDLKNTLDKLLDMITLLPGIVICNCHAKIKTMSDGTDKILPYIDGSTKEDVSKWFDFVLYAKTNEDLKGNVEFVWRTAKSEMYDNAKDRTQLLDREIPQDYQLLFNAAKERTWDGAKILILGTPGAGKTYALKTLNKGN
ncbi:MAG: AAA family ATPase [Pelagibacterales bacterium]|nr:AAA family ATPase [Pelagibacterales bacterium]